MMLLIIQTRGRESDWDIGIPALSFHPRVMFFSWTLSQALIEVPSRSCVDIV
jgi:hypothetical protein